MVMMIVVDMMMRRMMIMLPMMVMMTLTKTSEIFGPRKIEQIWEKILVKNAKGHSRSNNQCNDSSGGRGAGSYEE